MSVTRMQRAVEQRGYNNRSLRASPDGGRVVGRTICKIRPIATKHALTIPTILSPHVSEAGLILELVVNVDGVSLRVIVIVNYDT